MIFLPLNCIPDTASPSDMQFFFVRTSNYPPSKLAVCMKFKILVEDKQAICYTEFATHFDTFLLIERL